MACNCDNKKVMCECAYVSELARKAAILEQCIYVVYKKADDTYCFDKVGSEIEGTIVEFRHYM
ncbi:hypothetical protein [Bacteroides sp.]|uniref:hypothetical protein n=1 Tax=Bacteroides sp. TaxID=29523 RepID=UPI00262D336C|nr:hypothetical protein [Bacteroides sp.]